ncbi:peptidase, S8/S53 family [Bacteriovorax sp. Seq25_V]|nr:peptidase, S8/S53 family [Bacteriovorax sp. Seq25_V]
MQAIIDGNKKIIDDFSFLSKEKINHQASIAIIGDYVHPEAFDTIKTNDLEIPNNGIDDDHNGYIDDYYGMDFEVGHGRTSAPILSGHENGIVSTIDAIVNHYNIQNKISVIPINITMHRLNFDELYIKKLADAIDYARIRGASVISMSLGVSNAYRSFFKFIDNDYEKSFKYLQDAIDRAVEEDILLLSASSNNSGRDHILDPEVPTNNKGVISVANVDYSGKIQSAYGENITTAYFGTGIYVWGGEKEGDLKQKGSSYATPLVALSLTIAKAQNPKLAYGTKLLNKIKRACQAKIKAKKNVASKCIFSPKL